MGASFDLFPELPPELRALIWKFSLHQEARSRIVPIHRRRILPGMYLCSPILSVNVESRYSAQRFYNARVSVSLISSLRLLDFPNLHTFQLRCDGGGHDMEEVMERWATATEKSSCASDRGVVYVSPEFDTFFLDNFLIDQFWEDEGLWMSKELPLSACANVRDVVRGRRANIRTRIYDEREFAYVWQTAVFKNLKTYRTLAVDNTFLRTIFHFPDSAKTSVDGATC